MRILFVEDDALNRRVVRDMLAIAGIAMAEAEDAESGLSMIDQADYDIVLMDLRMPGMDGNTAIRRIRGRNDDKAQVPIIVLTADQAHDLRARCFFDGANKVLLKPVPMDDLFDALGEVIATLNEAII